MLELRRDGLHSRVLFARGPGARSSHRVPSVSHEGVALMTEAPLVPEWQHDILVKTARAFGLTKGYVSRAIREASNHATKPTRLEASLAYLLLSLGTLNPSLIVRCFEWIPPPAHDCQIWNVARRPLCVR